MDHEIEIPCLFAPPDKLVVRYEAHEGFVYIHIDHSADPKIKSYDVALKLKDARLLFNWLGVLLHTQTGPTG